MGEEIVRIRPLGRGVCRHTEVNHATAVESELQQFSVDARCAPARIVIVLNEASLRRVLKSYFDYYERSRTHLSLDKDAPVTRPIQPASMGRIVEISQVGGLHHRYERVAA
jgi:hypothetical protein